MFKNGKKKKKKSENLTKSPFFKFFFVKKNSLPLVLTIEEISL